MAVLLLPQLLLMWRVKPEAWAVGPLPFACALMVINVLYSIDSIPNAMVNPIFTLAIGGLSGLLAHKTPAVVVELPRRRVMAQDEIGNMLMPPSNPVAPA
jgi:hypothetical protein